MLSKEVVFQLAKGFQGKAKNCIRVARLRVQKALQYSYRDRRNKKRDMLQIYPRKANEIKRIFFIGKKITMECYKYCLPSTYCHLQQFQVTYGNFIHGLQKENIQLNRKVLSELAMHEPYSFKSLVDIAKNSFPGNRVTRPIPQPRPRP